MDSLVTTAVTVDPERRKTVVADLGAAAKAIANPETSHDDRVREAARWAQLRYEVEQWGPTDPTGVRAQAQLDVRMEHQVPAAAALRGSQQYEPALRDAGLTAAELDVVRVRDVLTQHWDTIGEFPHDAEHRLSQHLYSIEQQRSAAAYVGVEEVSLSDVRRNSAALVPTPDEIRAYQHDVNEDRETRYLAGEPFRRPINEHEAKKALLQQNYQSAPLVGWTPNGPIYDVRALEAQRRVSEAQKGAVDARQPARGLDEPSLEQGALDRQESPEAGDRDVEIEFEEWEP